MKRKGYIILSIAALAATSLVFAGDAEPGLWEITVESRAPGGSWSSNPLSLTQCLTKHDTQDPSRLISSLTAPGATDCRYVERIHSGNEFKFAMVCGGSFGLIAKGNVTFSSDSFSGDITATASVTDGRAMEFQNRISGKRLGSCGN